MDFALDLFSSIKSEIEKSTVFNIAETVEYIPNSVQIKTIIRKATGFISAISYSGEAITKLTPPFDIFIQIIDGKAQIVINGISHLPTAGEFIVIPAHHKITIGAIDRFKMTATVIKSGCEDFRNPFDENVAE
ncbi:cupin domain-containing protein [Chryseolinea serpens]|uniref:hypothetical protein n=1 Tax=Chryseolinea serpens TaxID=947013 RepID=UPI0009346725|nr:hypothetical protein [Chryseolinea serpens]